MKLKVFVSNWATIVQQEPPIPLYANVTVVPDHKTADVIIACREKDLNKFYNDRQRFICIYPETGMNCDVPGNCEFATPRTLVAALEKLEPPAAA